MLLKTSRRGFLIGSTSAALAMSATAKQAVQELKAPTGALQPQAVVDTQGVIHLIYLYGDPAAADIGYVSKRAGESQFSRPVRVNSQPGSAIALGTVRGARLSLGKGDRLHVVWNGSSIGEPKGPRNSAPMLYTRLNDNGKGFEPQRSLMTIATPLDGGGAVASDREANVFVAWHALGQQDGVLLEGEAHRRVWMARSIDNGETFGAECQVSPAELGACGCCGMGAITDESGNLYLLFRTARETVHRDMYLLVSRDQGQTFESIDLHPWQIAACPMSTVSMTTASGRVFLAWETASQVHFASVDSRTKRVGEPVAAPGAGMNRKHPSIAVDDNGKVLLAWTEGTGWKRGGSLGWQMFGPSGHALGPSGGSPGLPAWDFAAAVRADGRFLVIS